MAVGPHDRSRNAAGVADDLRDGAIHICDRYQSSAAIVAKRVLHQPGDGILRPQVPTARIEDPHFTVIRTRHQQFPGAKASGSARQPADLPAALLDDEEPTILAEKHPRRRVQRRGATRTTVARRAHDPVSCQRLHVALGIDVARTVSRLVAEKHQPGLRDRETLGLVDPRVGRSHTLRQSRLILDRCTGDPAHEAIGTDAIDLIDGCTRLAVQHVDRAVGPKRHVLAAREAGLIGDRTVGAGTTRDAAGEPRDDAGWRDAADPIVLQHVDRPVIRDLDVQHPRHRRRRGGSAIATRPEGAIARERRDHPIGPDPPHATVQPVRDVDAAIGADREPARIVELGCARRATISGEPGQRLPGERMNDAVGIDPPHLMSRAHVHAAVGSDRPRRRGAQPRRQCQAFVTRVGLRSGVHDPSNSRDHEWTRRLCAGDPVTVPEVQDACLGRQRMVGAQRPATERGRAATRIEGPEREALAPRRGCATQRASVEPYPTTGRPAGVASRHRAL